MKRFRIESSYTQVFSEANTARWKMTAGCIIVMKKARNEFIEYVLRADINF